MRSLMLAASAECCASRWLVRETDAKARLPAPSPGRRPRDHAPPTKTHQLGLGLGL